MNAPIGEEQETESGDLIPDPQAEEKLKAVDDEAEHKYFREHLEAALACLSPVQAAVIRGKYYRRQTNPQIAETLHVTPQDVRRELGKGLLELRGKKLVLEIDGDYLKSAAYHGTGWNAWYYEQGSIEERLTENVLAK